MPLDNLIPEQDEHLQVQRLPFNSTKTFLSTTKSALLVPIGS
jgi:hypothetical protein